MNTITRSPADLLPADLLPADLLPEEPRIDDAPRQQMLTERFLLPALPELRALLLHLRTQLDPALAERIGGDYPRGRCRDIALALERALLELAPAQLPEPVAAGLVAFARFVEQGGNVRLVWGALRGQGLRHVFLFGTLCVDVAPDSVVPGPPQVTIVPLAQARLTPVHNHRQYALLMASQFDARVYPNHVLPDLAPHVPLLMLVPGGSARLEARSPYMLALARRSGFTSSFDALHMKAMSHAMFNVVANTLAAAGFDVADSAGEGKAAALEACRQARDARPRAAQAQEEAAIAALKKANRALQILTVSAPRA